MLHLGLIKIIFIQFVDRKSYLTESNCTKLLERFHREVVPLIRF